MSQYLKQAEFQGGAQFLNQVADLTVTGQPDALGVLPGAAYGGGLSAGDYLRLNDAEALALSKTSVGTLYRGVYRRVQLKTGITGGGTTGFKRGQIVFWDIETAASGQFVVTNVEATDTALMAGIIINATDTSGAPLSGSWVWIQTAGVATVQFRATIGAAGPAIGDVVTWAAAGAGADNGTADDVLATGAVTTNAGVTAILQKYIGKAVDAPANGALKRVMLTGMEPLNL